MTESPQPTVWTVTVRIVDSESVDVYCTREGADRGVREGLKDSWTRSVTLQGHSPNPDGTMTPVVREEHTP